MRNGSRSGWSASASCRIAEYRVVPMLVERDGAPYVHGNDEKGRATVDYLRRVTAEAGLNARLRWVGDEAAVE